MFGRKRDITIGDSLSRTRPVRYPTMSKPKFRRLQPASLASIRFGNNGVKVDQHLAAEKKHNGSHITVPVNGTKVQKGNRNLESESGILNVGHSVTMEGAVENGPVKPAAAFDKQAMDNITACKDRVLSRVMELIDAEVASKLTPNQLAQEFGPITNLVLQELKITLNRAEQVVLENALIDELVGYGPLEVLLKDRTVSDILVNGYDEVYVERNGHLELTEVCFRDDDHVLSIANRIVNRVGRRIDQTMPLCDARLDDGSRVNVVIPPLMVNGPVISIRKFADKPLTLDIMAEQKNLSAPMAVFLKAAAASRLNILVSGGTGSGKTTLLNAMSKLIDSRERIITIEDAAELQLQQPHVLSMETRPANMEGRGEVTIRDLMVNSLRMRPDRIILGEVRGPECMDMLQAMNTGHDGSMCTLHANRPREALTRMENMATMSGLNYRLSAIRTQISQAIDIIVQVARMRDGMRRVTSITEVVGMEGDIITTQELFKFKFLSEDAAGMLHGVYEYKGIRPACYEKLREFGLDRTVMEALGRA